MVTMSTCRVAVSQHSTNQINFSPHFYLLGLDADTHLLGVVR